MNQNRMKLLLIRDKEFLKSLYQSQSVPHCKNILTFASDSKLNTLINFLHFVSNGEIKIKKEQFALLEGRYLRIIRKHFESKKVLKELLMNDRKTKLDVLLKVIISVLSFDKLILDLSKTTIGSAIVFSTLFYSDFGSNPLTKKKIASFEIFKK